MSTFSGILVHVGTQDKGKLSKDAQKNIDLAVIEQLTIWKDWQAQSMVDYDALPEPKPEYNDWGAPGRRSVLMQRARIILGAEKTEYRRAGWNNRKTYRALKESIEAIVNSLELGHLDRDVLEGEFAVPCLLDPEARSAAPARSEKNAGGRPEGVRVDGAKVRELRGDKIQEAFAHECNVSVDTIQRLEYGRPVSEATLNRFSRALGLSPDDLKE